MKCVNECKKTESACSNDVCRHWMDYPDDLNCSIVAADWHGPMTLDEISKRLKISLVMVGHIEQKALVKLRKKNQDLKDVLHE